MGVKTYKGPDGGSQKLSRTARAKRNADNLAMAKNKKIDELNVCLLDRPRHKKIIDELKFLKVNIKLISDGDIIGALTVANEKSNVDLFLGIGGGPEGVIAAAALSCHECQMQSRLIFQNKNEILRAKKMNIKNLNKKYDIKDLVKGDVIFCATGITSGSLVVGIKNQKDKFTSETYITHKSSNYIKKLTKALDK